jgi:pimeloyl-ACP methyl ester carboxylesterase
VSEIREYLSQFDAAAPRAMAEMLRNPSPEQEQALRTYLGGERYRRMRGLALRLFSRHRSRTIGRVVLIPDFMGIALSRIDWDGTEEPTPIWMNIARLMVGQFDVLRLSDDGFSGADRRFDIIPTGVFKRDYGELLLTLAQDWDVRVLWYDWRKDLRVAASSLESKLGEWYGVDQPVHLVGFGMGGLVARWFIHEYPDRWKAMWNEQGSDGPRQGGRLLLLGVPNQGTFLIPQILTGHSEITHRLDQIDQRQNHLDIVRTFRTFVSLYQLLPRPEELFAHLYEPDAYLGNLQPHGQTDRADDLEHYRTSPIPKGLFANARKFEAGLEGTIDARRTVAVSAYGIPTVVDYERLPDSNLAKAWLISKDGGDGIVPLQLARPDIEGVREYFIRDEHAALISNPKLLSSLTRLLAEGRTETLPDQPPTVLPGKPLDDSVGTDKTATTRNRSLDEIGATHLNSRRSYPEPDEPTVEEREVGEMLTRDLSGGQAELLRAEPTHVTPRNVAIEIGLIHGTIVQVDELLALSGPQNPPVDALAVGLYVGEKPSGPTLKLDRAISKTFLERTGRELTDDSPLPERDLILTQFALRGLIRGELGQPFFLTDPRVSDVCEALPGRLLAVVGMGVPGRFGVPELTVMVRELCWAIGRVGKKHLAVAAIGMKDNNLSAAEAISGWVRGIKSALAGADIGEFHLQRLTLVIHEAGKIKPLQEAIMAEQRKLNSQAGQVDSDIRFNIGYTPYNPDELKEFQERAIKDAKEKVEKHKGPKSDWRPEPTRVTLGLSGSTYRYGAIMTGASVSER